MESARLVLLHGLPFDARMWQAELDWLPDNTLAPSLYRLGPTLADWAHAVLDLAGDEPLILVGCSVGGSCAIEVAAAAPQQVVGVVLVGAKVGVRPEPQFRDEALRVLDEDGMSSAWPRYWEPLFGRNASPDVVAAARAHAFEQETDDIANGVRAFHDRRDLTPFAMTWPSPIVAIRGDLDRTPDPASAGLLTEGPMRSLHLVPDCGHYVNLEQPAAVRRLLASAINRCMGRV